MLTSGTDLLQDILRGHRAARASSCLTSGALSRLASGAWPTVDTKHGAVTTQGITHDSVLYPSAS